MANRLADEQSPYLRQHKDNPVNWFPWGEDAFDKAQEEDKPIFLSIGYATCHWCHVMERESFEDEEVARLMNETFVSIKVDREERPDVDSLYMDVCQMMRGRGGWPLTVLLTPDRKPFFAATYLPKEGRFQQMGMVDLVPKVRRLWENNREALVDDANDVTDTLRRGTNEEGGTERPGTEVLNDAYQQLCRQFDGTHGGFGSAPKFPAPHNLLFLLRQWHRTGEAKALDMVTKTLDEMRLGGMYDQIGYGFHRYSTDQRWVLPHFEKMLYDQAMHVMAYTEAYQATGKERFRRTAEEVIEYVRRDLQAPEGGFYSAEDADSLNEEGEMEEGAFYVWSIESVREELDDENAELFIDLYNMSPTGNYTEERSGERTGKNVLYLDQPLTKAAADRGIPEEELLATVDRNRSILRDRRTERARPALDDKILTDWNGLMIAALATAARVFDEAAYETEAVQAATFLLNTMQNENGDLLHRYREREAGVRGQLDDYAFLIWGLIELYETTFDSDWLDSARSLMETSLDQFWDDEHGGFFLTAADAEALIVRPKDVSDGALPSGNSVQLSNLLRLAHLTGRTDWEKKADALARWGARPARSRPTGLTAFLSGLQFALGSPREVVIAGPQHDDATQALHDVVRSVYSPSTVVLHRPPDATQLIEIAPFTEPQTTLEGQPAAYVCRNHQCRAPTTDPDLLREQLRGDEQIDE